MSRNLPYNRADRVAKQIYQIIASHIYEDVDDARLNGLQITSARLTNDLSLARVYFYIEGGRDKLEAAKAALEDVKPELRHLVGRELVLKTLPRIEFFVDEGIENAQRIDEILKSLK